VGVISWGLLGPETLAGERRTRTLGLGATVRSFNDLAVPGLGGVWFGKELLLATFAGLLHHLFERAGNAPPGGNTCKPGAGMWAGFNHVHG